VNDEFASGEALMHRLNAFAQFESQKGSYENPLTRAFLVVLRLVPQAHARFLSLIAAKRTAASALPNLSIIGGNNVVFQTQTGSFPRATRLLSILLTDRDPGERIPVAAHPRTAVYDGVIAYAQDWVFIIENKPRCENVWKEQLSPGEKDVQETEVEVEGTAVILEWQDVLRELATLIESRALEHAASGLVADFLDFVYDNFPFLNPYDTLGPCGDNKELLNNRYRLAMEAITQSPVDYRPGWGYYMRFHGGASQDVRLDAEGAGADLMLRLSLHPGDTQNKAKLLYNALDVQRICPLQKNGWQVKPNFHLAFRSDNLVHCKGTMPLLDYIAFWQENQDLIHQMPCGPESEVRELFKKYVELLARKGIISDDEKPAIFKVTVESNHTKINVCPGISLFYRWEMCNAVGLDRRDLFVAEVRARLQEAFDAWGQKV
jgi:hypothetical protein